MFKEVSIIRPLEIGQIKQIDVLLDMSLLQELISSIIASNFLDLSKKQPKRI